MLKNAVLVLSLFVGSLSFAQGDFPLGPDENLTPGAVCTQSGTYRYPEHIKYCERNVSTNRKKDIYEEYDRLGYRTLSKRGNFKIDHYIPLCAGGANDSKNLWPQHRTVYEITDKLEEVLCIKMSEGKLKQKDAIDLIKDAKNHLEKVPEIEKYVRSL